MPRRPVPLLLAFATAAAVTVSLTGCVGGGADSPSPKPTASKSALFSSDEEALKAAEKAYQAYLDVTNKVGHGGWKDSSDLASVMEGDLLKTETAGAKDFAARGYVLLGDSSMDSMRVQSARPPVVVYVCRDVSKTDVVDSSGKSIVPAERQSRVPLQVTFGDRDGTLIVSRSVTWSGDDFC
ncbi:hypothetical protein [Schumannella soli]|uniref:Lipoprotein n=1 Tax=Schumannella soli TaxID=2590779 RepID=A0A506XZW5_9MICO|nr:hypothetical protein [Schumannella soli]TPW75776.1 hypothetical protein FJ657_07875 [Schumannella soli]